MAQYKITKQVDFGNFTIGDKNYGPACPSCMVPINNYAPKIGDVIEGTLETKPISDGNGHIVTMTGITWPIRTNGSASTTGQTSIQFISQDHFQPVVVPGDGGGNGDQPNPNPIDPNVPTNNTESQPKETGCWMCENKIPILIGILLLVGLFFAFNND